MLPKVSIIILNWNGKEDTIQCIESLRKINYLNYDIIIVDNGSTDGSVPLFKEIYPDISLIENKENLGFAEGNNVGIKKAIGAGTDYVLLLNNDTVVDKDFLLELVNVAEMLPKAGILGPKIYFYNSNRIQSFGGKISLFRGIVYNQCRYKNDLGNQCIIKNTGFITGCAMLIKRGVFEDVGFFDNSYFAYYEDTDLCMRLITSGYELVCVPTSLIWHKGSQSSKVSRISLYYSTRNMIKFEKKYANNFQFSIFVIYFFLVRFPILICISLLYHRRFLSLRRCVDGTVDGFLGDNF